MSVSCSNTAEGASERAIAQPSGQTLPAAVLQLLVELDRLRRGPAASPTSSLPRRR